MVEEVSVAAEEEAGEASVIEGEGEAGVASEAEVEAEEGVLVAGVGVSG